MLFHNVLEFTQSQENREFGARTVSHHFRLLTRVVIRSRPFLGRVSAGYENCGRPALHRLVVGELLGEREKAAWEATTYTRSARTIRRFLKVGMGVHVCSVTMSLPLTCAITHDSSGSTMKVWLTLYL